MQQGTSSGMNRANQRDYRVDNIATVVVTQLPERINPYNRYNRHPV
ncbi:hypothetical protein OAL43_02310 [bacterium]|jgi:hypothetical protein|nr:hypothetical protein [bacterium]